MPKRKKQSPLAREAVWVEGKNPDVRTAWKAFEQGDRKPLLLILQRDIYKLNSPDLEQVILQLAAQASIPIKRKRGRPRETGKIHSADERAEIAKRVSWLIKIKPMLKEPKLMTEEHACNLVKEMRDVMVGERTLKKYCREFNRK